MLMYKLDLQKPSAYYATCTVCHLHVGHHTLDCMQDVKSSKTTFTNRTQQCFAVRSGVDSILDLARSTFCCVTEQVHELVDKYKTEYGMEALKVRLSLDSPCNVQCLNVPWRVFKVM